jgi:homotetrameric cytidine deaminase
LSGSDLVAAAREARAYAHAEFSTFKVGAALETADGTIVTGCNIENATYGLTVCAERVAVWKAVSEGLKRFDAVASVLAAQAHNPAGASLAVEALERATGSPDWPATLQAFARCVRILRGLPVDPGASGPFTHPAESALDAALKKAEAGQRRPGSVEDFLGAMRPLVPAITSFFEDVLVMSEDPAERRSRLALVRRVAALADGVADLSRLEGF